MVWGAISTAGTIGLCVFTDIMNAQRYIDILKTNLLPAASRLFEDNWRFQQDNDPKHTARVSVDFLSQNAPSIIDWPANSPDLNPIENVWGMLKRRVEMQQPKNIEELIKVFMDEWNRLDKSVVINLIHSMKSRCKAVISANGDHIDY
jgi:transposase